MTTGKKLGLLIGGGALALALILALYVLGPSPRGERQDDYGPLAARGFSLGGERFEIELPEAAKIAEDASGAFVWIDLRPGARSSPSIWIETPYDNSQPFDFDRKISWGPVAIDYRLSVNDENAGSGGAEANLDGRLTVAGRLWGVSCVLQHEGIVAREADWCLRFLRSLKATVEPAANTAARRRRRYG